ncbi:MAG TPA: hypothetical protein VH208_11650 [Myxococcaceae bacterium]|nr:hypothetical protein [Myxococcaceae bacterium]
MVELWQHEDALALHEADASVAWVGVQAKGRDFCFDARRLVEGHGLGPGWTSADSVSWTALQEVIGRPDGPRVVAVWTNGSTRFLRNPSGGRPPSGDPLAKLAALPGPIALRYLSPAGSRLQDRLLTLEGPFTRNDAQQIIDCAPGHIRNLLLPGSRSRPPSLVAVKFGVVWSLDPVSVYTYAASEHPPGHREPGSPTRWPLSQLSRDALALLQEHEEVPLGLRTSLADGTVKHVTARGLERRGLVTVDPARKVVRLIPGTAIPAE